MADPAKADRRSETSKRSHLQKELKPKMTPQQTNRRPFRLYAAGFTAVAAALLVAQEFDDSNTAASNTPSAAPQAELARTSTRGATSTNRCSHEHLAEVWRGFAQGALTAMNSTHLGRTGAAHDMLDAYEERFCQPTPADAESQTRDRPAHGAAGIVTTQADADGANARTAQYSILAKFEIIGMILLIGAIAVRTIVAYLEGHNPNSRR